MPRLYASRSVFDKAPAFAVTNDELPDYFQRNTKPLINRKLLLRFFRRLQLRLPCLKFHQQRSAVEGRPCLSRHLNILRLSFSL